MQLSPSFSLPFLTQCVQTMWNGDYPFQQFLNPAIKMMWQQDLYEIAIELDL